MHIVFPELFPSLQQLAICKYMQCHAYTVIYMHIPLYTFIYDLMYFYVFGTYLVYVYARILVSICTYCTYLYVFKAWKVLVALLRANTCNTCINWQNTYQTLIKYVPNTCKYILNTYTFLRFQNVRILFLCSYCKYTCVLSKYIVRIHLGIGKTTCIYTY
jgi:hypothetical protein